MGLYLKLLDFSKDYVATMSAFPILVLSKAVTTAKWRDVLEKEQFSSQCVALVLDEYKW